MSQSDRNPPVSHPNVLAEEGVAATVVSNVEGGGEDDGRPKFTSVAMDGGGTDQQRLLRSAAAAVPSSSGANRPNSSSIQRPKPLGKSSRPPSIGKPQRLLAAGPSSSRGTSPVAMGTSSGVGNELFSVENTSQASWNVTDESLQSLPPYYPPLEKQSSVVINDGTPAAVVAKRISDCFRERSITVEFDNKQNLARARTWDNITFSVKLHRESNDNDFGVWPGEEEVVPSSQSGGGVIVEVQLLRASGPTGEGSRIVFYRDYCRPILRAAAGFGGNGMPSLSRGERRRPGASSSSVVFPVSSSRLYRCTDDIPPAKLRTSSSNMVVPEEKTLLALENVLDLLKKDRIDANRLGMESLYLLTNVNSVGYDTALVVAHVILHGRCCSSSAGDDDNNEENVATGMMDSSAYGIVFGEIHDVIVALIQHRRLMLGGFSIEDGDSSDDDDSSSSDDGHGRRGRGAGGGSACDMAMTTDVLEREHVGLFHNLALKALTNSLQLFYDLGRHADIASSPFCNLVAASSVADHPSSSPHPPVFAVLLGEIDEVSHPSFASSLLGAGHNGALAARCVDIMTRTCPEIREYATTCVDATGIMEGARRSTGGMHHPILVRETESVLDVLRTTAAAPAAR